MLPKNFKGIDLTGQKFGQWTVLGFLKSDPQGSAIWTCRCSCNKTWPVSARNLRSGKSTKCVRCSDILNRLKHGHNKDNSQRSRSYVSWCSMKARCLSLKCKDYRNYGGRGITICESWANPETGFQNFLADMGERPEGRSLDRINNDGNYEPGNCRWSTAKEQANNRRPGKRKSK